jgi:hypothetical protein
MQYLVEILHDHGVKRAGEVGGVSAIYRRRRQELDGLGGEEGVGDAEGAGESGVPGTTGCG